MKNLRRGTPHTSFKSRYQCLKGSSMALVTLQRLSGKVNREQGACRQSDCLHDFTLNGFEIENMMLFNFENPAEV